MMTPAKNSGSVLKSAKKWKAKTFHMTPKKATENEVTADRTEDAPKTPQQDVKPAGLSYGISPTVEDRIVCLNPAEIM
jgi:hypothetical protein